MRDVALLLAAVLLVSGCVGGSRPADGGDIRKVAGAGRSAAVLPEGELAPGCDATRPTWIHTTEGQILHDYRGPAPVACLVSTPWGGFEPTVGLTSDGALFLYPARGAPLAGGQTLLSPIGTARSKDEGANWTRQLSQIGPANWHPYTADPYMYVDAATNRIFSEDLVIPPFNCSNLSYSDDGGETWTQTLGGCMEFDHVSFYAGKPVSSTTMGYPNVIYRCGINLVLTAAASTSTTCQKSIDGGRLWLPPGQPAFGPVAPNTPTVPPCHGGAHHVFVDHRGWVWLPRGWCFDPHVAISKDEGATWTRHKISTGAVGGGGISHDAGVGVDLSGTAYYFWMNEKNQPSLAVSRDGGVTWGKPMLVGPPSVVSAAMPSLMVGGKGNVAFSYVANLDLDGGTVVHGLMTMGFGVDTERPIFMTGVVNPPEKPIGRGACRGQACQGQGDFLSVRIGPDGTPWASFMNSGLLSAGRLWGGPSLWDADDANGPYKD